MNETFYKAMLDDSSSGYACHQIVLDNIGNPCDYEFIYVNPAFEKMTGLSASKLLGKRASQVLPGYSGMPFWLETFMEVSQKGVDKEIENYLNGSYKTRVFSPDKSYIITRLTEASETPEQFDVLQKGNESIFNGTQDALFLIKIQKNDFIYEKFNETFEKYYCIKNADLLDKTPEGIFGPKLGSKLRENYNRCIQAGVPISYEQKLPLPEGDRTWMTKLSPVFIDGKPVYIIGSSTDITLGRKAEAELQSSLKRIEKILEIVKSDKESEIEIIQDALEHSLIFTRSKIGCLFTYDEYRKKFNHQIWANQLSHKQGVFQGDCIAWLEKAAIWIEVINQRKPLIFNDFQRHGLKQGIPQAHTPIKRLLILPVFNENKIVAVVGVANRETDYNDNDILHLELLMNNVWAVVERKKSETLLREEKELFKTTLLSIGDGIMATDQAGNVIVMNEVAQKLTGWSNEEAFGKPFEEIFTLLNRKTQRKSEDPVRKVLETGEKFNLGDQTVLVSREGIERPISDSAAPITGENGEVRGVVLAFRDITVEQQKMNAIEYLSYHDQLTGLFNRRFFEEEVRRLNTKRNLPIAIIMADVNGLKLTNDAFGHNVGDKLLQKAAEVLRKCCRQDDIIARIGGDEFIILLPNTGAEFAERIVNRIRVLCKSIRVKSVGLSISFGWEAKTGSQEEIKDIMKKAEDKMYRSKLCESPSMRGETLQTIIGTLYTIHNEEEGHSKKVAELCEAIGRELGMDERDLKEIKNAGLLHDIGKIAVDGAILNKEDPLNEQEWQEIRRHPEIGYRILYSVSDLTNIAEVVLEHHERWDGSGYPRNLREEEISIQARIVALADAYVTMTHERAYCGCLSEEDAIDQIVKNAGSQFDPNLAKLMVEKILGKPKIWEENLLK